MRPQKRIIQNSHLVQLGRCAWAAVGLAAGLVVSFGVLVVVVGMSGGNPVRSVLPLRVGHNAAPHTGGQNAIKKRRGRKRDTYASLFCVPLLKIPPRGTQERPTLGENSPPARGDTVAPLGR